MTGKEFETVLNQIRGSDPSALLINIIKSKRLFRTENIGTVDEYVLVAFSWLLARGSLRTVGPVTQRHMANIILGGMAFQEICWE
jgi:hypothetical protein